MQSIIDNKGGDGGVLGGEDEDWYQEVGKPICTVLLFTLFRLSVTIAIIILPVVRRRRGGRVVRGRAGRGGGRAGGRVRGGRRRAGRGGATEPVADEEEVEEAEEAEHGEHLL